MTNGEQLDRYLNRYCAGGPRSPRVHVGAVRAVNDRVQGWAVCVLCGDTGYEVAYVLSWRLAVSLAFRTANYIRDKAVA
ncbi:hypothetical protein [Nocardia ignorata]|uniref:Uncharacterized protein n=1 Tax=Nocardia ignorata TaxID=145285 RepID=A0A4R6NYP0_NOCIG|nr:hypothetical protein [Nocardia ignorata]TDP29880.1 hypothetical protein DFR75_112149 [Nocardia ignorata]